MLSTVEHKKYQEDGFLVLRGALEQSDIDELREVLIPLFDSGSERVREMAKHSGEGFQQPEIFRPTQIEPRLMKTSAYRKARDICMRNFGPSWRYVFDHAICKMPETSAVTPMHQDQAYMINGVALTTTNLWIPLQPTNEQNGTMAYVPGSHRTGLQAHHQSDKAAEHLLEADYDEADAVSVDMVPGDIAFHHPLTAHRAGPNSTDAPRYAWIVHFGPLGRLGYLHPRHAFTAISGKIRKQLAAGA